MTHSNLVLTEKAVKNHCKRVQKEMAELGVPMTLTQSQTFFSKILGFSHFHELKKIFNFQNPISRSNPLQGLAKFNALIQRLEPTTARIIIQKSGNVIYYPHALEHLEKNFVEESYFSKEDFQELLRLFLGEVKLNNLRAMTYYPKGHFNLSLYQEINPSLLRSLSFYFAVDSERTQITYLHIHWFYVKTEDSLPISRKYEVVQHLFKSDLAKADQAQNLF